MDLSDPYDRDNFNRITTIYGDPRTNQTQIEETLKKQYKENVVLGKEGRMLSKQEKDFIIELYDNLEVSTCINSYESKVFEDFSIHFQSYHKGDLKLIQENSIRKWEKFIKKCFSWIMRFGAVPWTWNTKKDNVIYPEIPNVNSGNFYVYQETNNQTKIEWVSLDNTSKKKWKTFVYMEEKLDYTSVSHPSVLKPLFNQYYLYKQAVTAYSSLLNRLMHPVMYMKSTYKDDKEQPKDIPLESRINPTAGPDPATIFRHLKASIFYQQYYNGASHINGLKDQRDTYSKLLDGKEVKEDLKNGRPSMIPLPPNTDPTQDNVNPGLANIEAATKKFENQVASFFELNAHVVFNRDVSRSSALSDQSKKTILPIAHIRKVLGEFLKEAWILTFPPFEEVETNFRYRTIQKLKKKEKQTEDKEEEEKEKKEAQKLTKNEVKNQIRKENELKREGEERTINIGGSPKTIIFYPITIEEKKRLLDQSPTAIWNNTGISLTSEEVIPKQFTQIYNMTSPEGEKLFPFEILQIMATNYIENSVEGDLKKKLQPILDKHMEYIKYKLDERDLEAEFDLRNQIDEDTTGEPTKDSKKEIDTKPQTKQNKPAKKKNNTQGEPKKKMKLEKQEE